MLSRIIERAQALNYPPLTMDKIKLLENKLQFNFAEDFYRISKVCDYEYLLAKGYEFYNFGEEGEYSVIHETLKMRDKLHLPLQYLILSTIDDVGVILLESLDNSIPHNKVLICSNYDFYNICKGEIMIEDPLIFPTFTDFFEYLLEEEEKTRQSS